MEIHMDNHKDMRRRKSDNTRKLQSSSGSYIVTLPIHVVRELGWRERQKLVVKKRGSGILISDWPVKKKR